MLVLRLPAQPAYLEDDHPERPDAVTIDRQARLLAASRWLMLMSYLVSLVFASLAPGIFARLGFETRFATGLAGMIDWCRLLAFIVLPLVAWWHGKSGPLIISMLALPVGLGLILFGDSVLIRSESRDQRRSERGQQMTERARITINADNVVQRTALDLE